MPQDAVVEGPSKIAEREGHKFVCQNLVCRHHFCVSKGVGPEDSSLICASVIAHTQTQWLEASTIALGASKSTSSFCPDPHMACLESVVSNTFGVSHRPERL
jgi:hypothetical protein